jgi:hypothetical protein
MFMFVATDRTTATATDTCHRSYSSGSAFPLFIVPKIRGQKFFRHFNFNLNSVWQFHSVKQDDDAIFDDAFESHGKSPTLILKRQCRSCFSAMLSQNLTSINLPAFTAARIFATKKLCERSDGSWNIGAWGELEFG